MLKRVREMLDQMDQFMVGATCQERDAFWMIMSAQRGPDAMGHEVKRSTTVPIRAAAFPQLALMVLHGSDVGNSATFTVVKNSTEVVPPREVQIRGDDHFMFHARKAAEALGLEVK